RESYSRRSGSPLLNDRQDVLLAEDQQLLVVDLQLSARILREQDVVADLDVQRNALLAVLVEPARTHRQHLTALRLLLGRIRKDDPTLRHLFTLHRANKDPVPERPDLRFHTRHPRGTSL